MRSSAPPVVATPILHNTGLTIPAFDRRTCGHHLVEFGVAVDCHADDVVIVLQIETLPLGEGLVHHARSRGGVDHRPVWGQEQVLPGVEPPVAKDEL